MSKIEWKNSAEIRRDGADRCRIKGCKIPIAPITEDNYKWKQPCTCGNHECDKPRVDFDAVVRTVVGII